MHICRYLGSKFSVGKVEMLVSFGCMWIKKVIMVGVKVVPLRYEKRNKIKFGKEFTPADL